MLGNGFIRRMLPFLATFTLGVFIASFFVSVALPRPGYRGPGKRYHKLQRLMHENERLRNENLRLRNELENRQNSWHNPNPVEEMNTETFVTVPPPPPAPVAPSAR